MTPIDSVKDVVRSSVKVPEFDKHQKMTGGYVGGNVEEITIKMKTQAPKPLMIKIIKLRLRNLDNKYCYCFYSIKWFQLLLSNTHNSIQLILFFFLQTVKWEQVLRLNTNDYIQHIDLGLCLFFKHIFKAVSN